MTFINLNGTDYRADMISRVTGIYQRENTHNFTITCDGKDYTFCEHRLSTVEELREHLFTELNKL